MANLIVSDVCNLACPYCFRGPESHRPVPPNAPRSRFLPLDDFRLRLEFLRRSGIDQVRLLGGEPTLHPDFPKLIAIAAAEGFSVVVFTHGLMPDDALEALAQLPADRCTTLVNVTASRRTSEPDILRSDAARRRAVLTRLALRAMPAVNLHTPDPALDPILDLILETGCRRVIRLGVALPALDQPNRALCPKNYRHLGHRIARFAEHAARRAVTLQFDCGFVPCMFTPIEQERLRSSGAALGWHCGPILDLTPDGRALHCYPLARFSAPLRPGDRAADLRSRLESATAPFRALGLFPECPTCSHRSSGACRGGCLAAVIRSLRPASFRLRLPPRPGPRSRPGTPPTQARRPKPPILHHLPGGAAASKPEACP